MAYEELPMPDYALPFGLGQGKRDDIIDFILTCDCIDTAFTDFTTHENFKSTTRDSTGRIRMHCSRV